MTEIEDLAMDYALPQRKYKLAIERYNSISKLLTNSGIECKIYPQGSFSYGAISKPYNNNKRNEFDLDVIVEFPDTSDDYPKLLMDKIYDILNRSPHYKNKVKKHENGFTIEFAGDFNMDIIPAKSEEEIKKFEISYRSEVSEYAYDSIKIPKYNNYRYSYVRNNPKGFKNWFDIINKKTVDQEYVMKYKRALYSESFSSIYSSVDEIPDIYIVTPLQKVIILLKRLRDVHYSRIKKVNKPLSGMICLLACKAIENHPYLSFNDTLKTVLDYIVGLEGGNDITSLHLNDGKWNLLNPTNCYDDLVDNWENSINDGNEFFNFIKKIRGLFILESENNNLNLCGVYNALGKVYENFANVANTGKSWKNYYIE